MATRPRTRGGAAGRSGGSSGGHSDRSRDGIAVEEASREAGEGAKCVLIVEDHPLNMKLFRVLLQSNHYEVLEAAEGRAGLDLARSRHPDLIVTDIQLPGLSGAEVIRELKTDESTRRIPVIAITASMPEEETAIRAGGGDAFMRKPIAAAEFLRLVRSLLGEGDAGC